MKKATVLQLLAIKKALIIPITKEQSRIILTQHIKNQNKTEKIAI